MRTIFRSLFSLTLIASYPLPAQVSISILPPSPTAGDRIVVTSSGPTSSNFIRLDAQRSQFGSVVNVEVKVYTGLLTIVDQWIFRDTLGLLPSGTYSYNLAVTLYQSTFQGGFVVISSQSLNRSFFVSPATIVDQFLLPLKLQLEQNYPNPFNPSTTIRFSLPNEETVTLVIFSVLGIPVKTLIGSERLSAAYHQITWDGKDNSGGTVPSGVYIYRLNAGSFLAAKTMTLLK